MDRRDQYIAALLRAAPTIVSATMLAKVKGYGDAVAQAGADAALLLALAEALRAGKTSASAPGVVFIELPEVEQPTGEE